eukprot:g425.t1
MERARAPAPVVAALLLLFTLIALPCRALVKTDAASSSSSSAAASSASKTDAAKAKARWTGEGGADTCHHSVETCCRVYKMSPDCCRLASKCRDDKKEKEEKCVEAKYGCYSSEGPQLFGGWNRFRRRATDGAGGLSRPAQGHHQATSAAGGKHQSQKAKARYVVDEWWGASHDHLGKPGKETEWPGILNSPPLGSNLMSRRRR